MTKHEHKTTEELFEMLKTAQNEYYQAFVDCGGQIDAVDNGAEAKLLAISHELRRRGENPLGW